MKDDCLERWLLLAYLATAGILAVVTVPADPLVLLTAFVGWGLILLLLLAALGAMLRAIASILLVMAAAMGGSRRGSATGSARPPPGTEDGRPTGTACEGRKP